MSKIEEYRQELQARRQALRGLYSRFRDLAGKMCQKGIVRYDKDRHSYIQDWGYSRPIREREAAKHFFKLQGEIQQMSMLLLELEHSIDFEEAKEEHKIRAEDTPA